MASLRTRAAAMAGPAMAIGLAAGAIYAQSAGERVYLEQCARCHDHAAAGNRIPNRQVLQKMSPEAIQTALTSGAMKEQGAALTEPQRSEVAAWLGAAPAAEADGAGACPANLPAPAAGGDWTGWGIDAGNRRYQAKPGFTARDVPQLQLKWAFAVPGVAMMRSQPVVYRGRIYLGGADGLVVSLDARTGCVHWSVKAGNVRSGLLMGRAGSREALFFGDATGSLHALALSDGAELWKTKISDHKGGLITGTPAYADGKLYVPLSSAEEVLAVTPGYDCCTFRGSVSAVDAATGKILWQTHTIAEAPSARGATKDGRPVYGPSGAGVWSSPTVDTAKGAVYVTTGDNYSDPATATSDAVLAFDLQRGALLWSKQFTTGDVFNLACATRSDPACKDGTGPDFDFGASPILATLPGGKRCLLLGQKSGMVYAVDPYRKGELLWQARAGRGSSLGGIQWGPATDGRLLFAAVSDLAFAKSADLKQLALNPDVGGGLAAYRVDSGQLVWKAPGIPCGERRPCSPAQSAAVTAIPGVVFSGSLDGHLRAYSVADGAVVWDFDTERTYDTVNHVAGSGGSIDAAGPVAAEGMLFVLSGYPVYGGKAGNVLLAFAVR